MPPPVPPLEVDCRTVKQRLDRGDAMLLLDCREPDEHALVCIEQAQLLPMSELQERLHELEPYRDAELIVHCHHGVRSLRVAAWLRRQGFAKAYSMTGGIDHWAVEIDPNLRRY